jgi:hypothetical protein
MRKEYRGEDEIEMRKGYVCVEVEGGVEGVRLMGKQKRGSLYLDWTAKY